MGSGNRWKRWSAELPSLLFLAMVVTLFFWDAIFTSRTYYLRDHLFTYRPYRAVVARMVHDHVLPLWCPNVYFGQPLHAVLIQVFYPTTLLNFFLPFESAFKAHIIVHYYIAVFGMYFLARRQALSCVSACAAAVSYALGSFLVSDGGFYNSVVTAGWAPWVILGLVSSARAPGLARGILAAWVLCLALFGGEAETLFFAVSIAYAIAVCEGEGSFLRRAVRATLVFAAVGALGVALAAVQVLPTWEMLSLSPRGQGLGEHERMHFSLAPLTSLEILAPKVLGNPAGDHYYFGGAFWGEGGRAQFPYFLSLYVGPAALCLWACGAILGRGRAPKVLGALALLSFVLMYGGRTPVYGWVLDAFTFLKAFRYPVKWFTLASLAGSLLAGFGLEALIASPWRELPVWKRRVWGAACAVSLALVAVGGWTWAVGRGAIPYLLQTAIEKDILQKTARMEECTAMLERAVSSVAMTTALLVGVLIAGAMALLGKKPRIAAWAIVLVTCVDLGRANLDVNRLVDPIYLKESNLPVLAHLPPPEDYPNWRIVSRLVALEYSQPEDLSVLDPDLTSLFAYHLFRQHGLHISSAIGAGLSSGNLFDPGSIYPSVLQEVLFELKRRNNDADWVTSYQRTGVKYVVSLLQITDPRVELIAPIKFLGATYPFRLYEVHKTLPRALLVPSAQRTEAPLDTWLSQEFDARREVLLGPGAPLPMDRGGPFEGKAEYTVSKDPNVFDASVDAPRDAWLLVLDSWSPGWKATVDGAPVTIEKADVFFRAVRVPAGRHAVHFQYDPWTFRVGAWTTILLGALSILLVLASLFVRLPVAGPVERCVDVVVHRVWPIALVGTVVWFHASLLSFSKCLYFGDHYFTYRPYRWVISQIWKQGELPLWNPYVMFGQPLHAVLIQVIYPTSLLYAVLPFEVAYNLHFLFHALVAALAFYALGRRLGWAPWIAYLGAVVWSLGGYVVSAEEFYNVIVTAAWAPAVLWGIDRAVEKTTARRIVVAALFLMLALLGGEIQTIGFTMLVGLAVWTRHLPSDRRLRWLGRAAVAGLACVALATLLSAFQVLPTYELLTRSPRAAGLLETERTKFSMSAGTAVELLFPRAWGDPATDMCYAAGALWNTPKFTVPPYLLSRYTSTVMLLLALFGGLALRGWRAKALAAMVVGGVVMMLGRHLPGYSWILGHIPFAMFVRYPIKFHALAALAQAVLVGEVLSGLFDRGEWETWRTRRWILGAGALVAVLLFLAGGVAWWKRVAVVAWAKGWLEGQGVPHLHVEVLEGGVAHVATMSAIGLFLVAALLLALLRPAWRRWSVVLLAGAVSADLSFANRGVNVVAPADELARRPPCLDLLPKAALSERLHSSSVELQDERPSNLRLQTSDEHDVEFPCRFNESILQPYTGLRYGVKYGVPFDPGRIYPSEFSYVRDLWMSKGSGTRIRFLQRAGLHWTFLLARELNFPELVERNWTHTLSQYDIVLYEVQGALPRAYVAAEEVAEPDVERAVDKWLSQELDPWRTVVVDGNPAPARGSGAPDRRPAQVISERSREVVLQADAPQGGTLVLLDSYAPGWKAWVDGAPAPVIRANALFRGVRLSPGSHTVRFYYDPASFRWGAAISILAALAAVALLVWPRRATLDASAA